MDKNKNKEPLPPEPDNLESSEGDFPGSPGHMEKAVEAFNVQEEKKFENTKAIREVLGDNKVNFFPHLPKLEWRELVGQEFVIVHAKIIEDWDSHFGTSDFPLLMIRKEDGTTGTTLGSGVAILKLVRKLLKLKALPVKVTLTMTPGQTGDYYNFV